MNTPFSVARCLKWMLMLAFFWDFDLMNLSISSLFMVLFFSVNNHVDGGVEISAAQCLFAANLQFLEQMKISFFA